VGLRGPAAGRYRDTALLTALYVILKRVNQNLALFAACLRLVETVIGVAATLSSFDVLSALERC
jgi:hypothetical protein